MVATNLGGPAEGAPVFSAAEAVTAWEHAWSSYDDDDDDQGVLPARPGEERAVVVGALGTRVVISRTPGTIYVAARGTKSRGDAALNAMVHLVPVRDVVPKSKSEAGIHAGFGRAATSVSAAVVATRLLADARRNEEVVFTGHSLGGAVAVLLALAASYRRPVGAPLLRVATFGAPPVGDAAFKALVEGRLRVERFAMRSDPVPHALRWAPHGTFEHAGALSSSYQRFSQEVISGAACLEEWEFRRSRERCRRGRHVELEPLEETLRHAGAVAANLYTTFFHTPPSAPKAPEVPVQAAAPRSFWDSVRQNVHESGILKTHSTAEYDRRLRDRARSAALGQQPR